ncbi:MAG: alpha/beta fold hydrolase [Burkholderiales bacterium]|nr:alpha/beta fold hydrolase [Burkholderiales bacterium]
MHKQRKTLRPLALAVVILAALGGCGGDSDPASGEIVSSTPYSAPAAIAADSRLLVHWMRGTSGDMVKATSLLFVPRGTAPAGGWPLVAWVHATTTSGSGTPAATDCAPSLSPQLDGGLTADGFPSGYVEHIAALVGAGFAVVAPDFEGLGPEAQRNATPYPYYNLSSSGRSVAAAVLAAQQAGVSLTRSWAAVGHSEGGHSVMALETSAAEASAYPFKGAVAFAPFNSIEASVTALAGMGTADPANLIKYRMTEELFVAMMGGALSVTQPSFTPDKVMGADLLAAMPSVKGKCIFKALGDVGAAVASKGPAAFKGRTATWASEPSMKAFLQTNDLAVAPGFKITKPTLVLQGGADPFVFESLQTSFVGRLKAAGMPVSYKTYPSADHGNVLVQGRSDMLGFLKANLP